MPSPGLIVSLPALILPLSIHKFPKQLALKVPDNVPRSPSFCSLASFLTVFGTPFINKSDPWSDSTI